MDTDPDRGALTRRHSPNASIRRAQRVATEAGQALYERARRIVLDSEEAWKSVRRMDTVPRGLLRVSMAPSMGTWLLGPSLVRYTVMYPETQLEVTATARHVDLAAERVDVAIRAGVVRDESVVVRRLAQMDLVAWASVRWLSEQRSAPLDIGWLQSQPCIVGFARGETPEYQWPLRAGGTVRVSGRFTTNEPMLALMACVAGQGVALLPRALAEEAWHQGVIAPVLPELVGAVTTLSVVYPSREFLEPKVRAFVDLMVDDVSEALASGQLQSRTSGYVRLMLAGESQATEGAGG